MQIGGGRARFENFTTGSKEKADELAKEGVRLNGGEMAQVRAITIQQKREEAHAALYCAATLHILVEEWNDYEELRPKPKAKWVFENNTGEAKKHRTEWCVAANEYRCVRCGKSSKHMKMQGACEGPRWAG